MARVLALVAMAPTVALAVDAASAIDGPKAVIGSPPGQPAPDGKGFLSLTFWNVDDWAWLGIAIEEPGGARTYACRAERGAEQRLDPHHCDVARGWARRPGVYHLVFEWRAAGAAEQKLRIPFSHVEGVSYEVVISAVLRPPYLREVAIVRHLPLPANIAVVRLWKPDGRSQPRYRIDNHSDITLDHMIFDCWTRRRHENIRLDVSGGGLLDRPVRPGESAVLGPEPWWKRLPEPGGHECSVRLEHDAGRDPASPGLPSVRRVDRYWYEDRGIMVPGRGPLMRR